MSAKFESSYGSSARHRTDSEETIIPEYDDDAIVINDDEFRNENRDDTRSIDDSSSGIVMSERNEGSSVSHEEIDPPAHAFEHEDEIIPTPQLPNEQIIPLIDEQMEPENLSLKESNKMEDKLVEDETAVVAVPEEDIPAVVIDVQRIASDTPTSRQRNNKGRSRVTQKQKRTINKQQLPQVTEILFPLNLILNSTTVTEQFEEFSGFDSLAIEDDNNFPLFGFPRDNNQSKISNSILLYEPLFKIHKESVSNKEIVVIKAPRAVRKYRKAKSGNDDLPKIQVIKCSSKPIVPQKEENQRPKRGRKKKAATEEPKEVPQKTLRIIRSCRVPEVHEEQKKAEAAKNEEHEKPRRGRKRKVETEPEAAKRAKKVVKDKPKMPPVLTIQNIEVKITRGKRKANEVESLKIQSNFLQPAASKRVQKRRIEEEPPKMPVPDKKAKSATKKFDTVEKPRKVRAPQRKRRNEIELTASELQINQSIKFEHHRPAIVMVPHPETCFQRPAPVLAPRFQERCQSLKMTYVDSKERPSLIPNRFTKPEPVEIPTIDVFSQTVLPRNLCR